MNLLSTLSIMTLKSPSSLWGYIWDTAYSKFRNIADELHTPINTLTTTTYIANISHTELNREFTAAYIEIKAQSIKSAIFQIRYITYLIRYLIFWIKITVPATSNTSHIEWNVPSKEHIDIKLNHVERLCNLLN